MSSELEKLERQVQRIRNVNSGLMSEIESLGGGVEIGIARIEHFIRWICEQMNVDPMDRWNEQLEWEKALKTQLVPMRDTIRERREAEQAAMERQRAQVQAQIDARQAAEKAAEGEEPDKKGPKIWTPGR